MTHSLPILLLCLLFSFQAQSLTVPPLKKPVVDNANMISSRTETLLNQLYREAKSKGYGQFAILTIPSLEDESLEGYSIKVVDQWKLGSEEKDKGLLILIAKKERQMRIEVGQGLEGVVPDITAGRIVQNMQRFFKQGDFDQGVLFASAKLFEEVGFKPKEVSSSSRSRRTKKFSLPLFLFLGIFFFLFRRNPLMALLFLSGSRSRGGGFGGGGFGGGGGYSGGGGGFSGGGASGSW